MQKEIKEKIDDANGNTDDCNAVVVYEQRGENGEDLRGDGNHTVFGASQSKHAVDIPVARVPWVVHKDYTTAELTNTEKNSAGLTINSNIASKALNTNPFDLRLIYNKRTGFSESFGFSVTIVKK